MTEQKNKKSKRVLWDSLTREKKEKDFSVWIGERGRYFFKHLESKGNNKKSKLPIVQVYLNRQYLTGLFPTNRKNEYSGDIKTNSEKQYLVFSIVNVNKLLAYRKV